MTNKYVPTVWEGGKTVGTAKIMNNMEKGIENAHERIDGVGQTLISSIHNSEGIIQKIMEVCKTYTDNFDKIIYGNSYTAWDKTVQQVNGKWELDCSSFQNLLIHGVTFENSRYAGNNENKSNPLFFNGIDSNKYRLANQIAKFGVENGYAFYPNSDFSNIETGDLVFYSWKDFETNPGKYTQEQINFHNNAFMKIDHVAMYLGKKNDTIYQTIQYERYTPQFLYNVSKDYMCQAVLVVRFPFANVENTQGNLVKNSCNIISCSSDSTIGSYELSEFLVPDKMYTACFNAELLTNQTYIIIKDGNGNTLYSDYGRTYKSGNFDYKVHFLCPSGITSIDKLVFYIGADSSLGISPNRSGKVNWCCLYDGYKRDVVKNIPKSLIYEYIPPTIKNITLSTSVSGILNNSMSPIYKVVEFDTYYVITLNIPLTSVKNGNLTIGSIGKKMGNTCRIPCNLIGEDGVTSYNAILQVSGTSNTGDIVIIPYSSSYSYKYIMASGIMLK